MVSFIFFKLVWILCIIPHCTVSPILSVFRKTANIYQSIRGSDGIPIQEEYDFIIIGAGSAGSVLASRLSEVKEWTVLLLEAGGEESLLSDIPLSAAYLQHGKYNWGYRAEKQYGFCEAMEDGRCACPKGRAIGGSSVINYMMYTRGSITDWNNIAAAGNSGWSYDEVLPYFIKSENANLKDLRTSPNHGRKGLMNIEDVAYRTPLVDAFLQAGRELGDGVAEDYNDGYQRGFGYLQANTKRGRRHSAARAFLRPFKNRTNLRVFPHSRVTKINISRETKIAQSVEYTRNRLSYIVRAKKEIILSAGAFGSPQLLMLSGIGPREHLEKFSIKLVQDLNVGRTMYDHPIFVGLTFLINGSGVALDEFDILSINNAIGWFANGKGPLTIAGGIEGLAYIKANNAEEADVELILGAGAITSDVSGAVRRGMKISDQFFNDAYRDVVGKQGWTIFPMLLRPKSKGWLELNSKNPYAHPKIYLNYFSNDDDLETMVAGIKYAIKVGNARAFEKFNTTLYSKSHPNCKTHAFGSDDYWKCAVKNLGTTIHHHMGTCKMGPRSDPDAVVDAECRVYGVKGLRVVDASVIPIALGAHTNAPTIMIAEKISDIIKQTLM